MCSPTRSVTSPTSTPSTRSRRTRRCSSAPARRVQIAARSSQDRRHKRLREGAREQVRPRRRDGRRQGVGLAAERPAMRRRRSAAFLSVSTSATRTSRSRTACSRRIRRPRSGSRRSRKLSARRRPVRQSGALQEHIKYQPAPVTSIAVVVGRRLGTHRIHQAGRRRKGRTEEEGFRPRLAEADVVARAADHAGVGLGRSARSRSRSPRKGRLQSRGGEDDCLGETELTEFKKGIA